MNTDLMFSSKTDQWATPQYFFDYVDSEFNFTLDACAGDDNHKCDIYYTEEMNGLHMPWGGRVWCNPPYGRQIGLWIEKALNETRTGFANVAVCLVPARTDARWFQDNAAHASEIRLIRGRIAFGNQNVNAPFPCALIVFRRGHIGPPVTSFYTVSKA